MVTFVSETVMQIKAFLVLREIGGGGGLNKNFKLFVANRMPCIVP